MAGLRAAGEATRVRLLALLEEGELTVKDATAILGQSQPRISRHMKLLTEAGLVQRFPEGSWVYYRLAEGARGALVSSVLSKIEPDDPVIARDRVRLAAIKRAHAEAAAAYFGAHAELWDTMRALHVAEDAVELAMREIVGPAPFERFLDLGTGTGRLLDLFSDRYEFGLGLDTSHDMLRVARANLERSGVSGAQVRHGDIYALPAQPEAFDVVAVHQVLHYLDDPAGAIAEAARALRPGGRLLVVDFAPHDLEFLRVEHAHRRLGFSHEHVAAWMTAAGLDLVSIRDLAPEAGRTDQLTVTLWLARNTPETGDARRAVSRREVA
ncbi:methyltransferase domain-containing protein [Breoghania sp. L-A4]|nr:methyltransferase domain-containing protein [Breoghania sp. L-A4]